MNTTTTTRRRHRIAGRLDCYQATWISRRPIPAAVTDNRIREMIAANRARLAAAGRYTTTTQETGR